MSCPNPYAPSASAPAPAPALPAASLPVPGPLGQSEKTKEGRVTAIKYINQWLEQNEYPLFDELTLEWVEGDNLYIMVLNIGHWFARGNFPTRQNTFLANSSKDTIFKNMKECFKEKFGREHDLFKDDTWFAEIKVGFNDECTRHVLEDPDVSNGRKSEPLYRDVTSDKSFLRAKYREITGTDLLSICKSMIKNGDRETAKKLLEIVITRQGIGRGGEIAFMRWNEATWDALFNCMDSEWTIIKQLDRQCMLFFCDRRNYELCPYFALGWYFMIGGLRRNGISAAHSQFVCPYLHNMRRDSVARRLTATIRAHIPNEAEKKIYSSRSLRSGAMTENAISGLTKELQYARSGHTSSEMNSNAEGYIAQSPHLSMPGGLALAGYDDLHTIPSPFRLSCLGESGLNSAMRMVDKLFIIDVPELKEDGRLRPVVMVAAASLIGNYSKLVSDYGVDNPIVKLIQTAAESAKIDDVNVPSKAGIPRWLVVLRSWSTTIKSDHHDRNPMGASSKDGAWSQGAVATNMQALSRRVESLEATIINVHDRTEAVDMVRDSSAITIQENKRLRIEIQRYKRVIAGMMQSPEQKGSAQNPPSLQDTTVDLLDHFEQSNPGGMLEQSGSVHPRTEGGGGIGGGGTSDSSIILTEPARKEARVDAYSALTQVPSIPIDKIGGITVSSELERLYKESILRSLFDNAPAGKPVSKLVLCSSNSGMRAHPAFTAASEEKRYWSAMTLVAISTTDDQWGKLLRHELEDGSKELRDICTAVEKETMLQTFELEKQSGVREPGSTATKAQPTLQSLHGRLAKIRKGFKESGMTHDAIETKLKSMITGVQQQQQSTLSTFSARR